MRSETFEKFLEEFPELKARSADDQYWIDEPLWEACQQVIDEGTDKGRMVRLWNLLREARCDDPALSSRYGQRWISYTHYHYERLQQWALTYQIGEDTTPSNGDEPPSNGDTDRSDEDNTLLWIQAHEHQEKEAEYREQVETQLEQRQHWLNCVEQLADYDQQHRSNCLEQLAEYERQLATDLVEQWYQEQQRAAELFAQWFEEQKRRTESQQAHEMRDLERRNLRHARLQRNRQIVGDNRRNGRLDRVGPGTWH